MKLAEYSSSTQSSSKFSYWLRLLTNQHSDLS